MTSPREIPGVLIDRLPYHPLLGRHVRHDARSLAYPLPVLPRSAIRSVHWPRRIPVLDQGQLGSCTGNAAAGWVGTDDTTRPGLTALPDGTTVDETLAVALYSAGTKLDDYPGSYPPDDTGCDGLSLAKVLQSRGLAAGYAHAFSADAVLAALQTGPGMWGTTWYQSMFDTDAGGHVRVAKSSGVAGGHEIVVDGLDVTAAGVVERCWFTNSWGTSWGAAGRGWVSPAELTGLLAANGDFTVPAAPSVVPTPDPVPPAPVVTGCFLLGPFGADHLSRIGRAAARHRETPAQYLTALVEHTFR